jgi:hypothetical protein
MKIQWETNVGNGVRNKIYNIFPVYSRIEFFLNLKQICSIEFDRKDIEQNKLTVCTLDSRIFVFDLTTKHPTKGYTFARQKVTKCCITLTFEKKIISISNFV